MPVARVQHVHIFIFAQFLFEIIERDLLCRDYGCICDKGKMDPVKNVQYQCFQTSLDDQRPERESAIC